MKTLYIVLASIIGAIAVAISGVYVYRHRGAVVDAGSKVSNNVKSAWSKTMEQARNLAHTERDPNLTN